MGQCCMKSVEVDSSLIGEGMVSGKWVRFAYNLAQGRRPYMEDTVQTRFGLKGTVLENTFFAGLFDGHGGSKVAEYCRDHLMEYIETGLKLTDYTSITEVEQELLESTISDVFLDLDDKIGTLPPVLVRNPPTMPCLSPGEEYLRDIENIGSTATTCLITQDKVVFANCGDSRTIMIRNNEVVFSTTDHVPSDVAETERIENAGGFVENNRVDGVLGVARALGDHRFKANEDLPPEMQEVSAAPELSTIVRARGDQFIVLASDGLWGVMSNDDVKLFVLQSVVERKESLATCSENLVNHACNKLYSSDNISVILIELVP